ncbi:tetratricopeptide repeat protein [Tundrisphaera lichenicola]|uniref:tetratricopeptide repeat protein n=1 Tax=Tundrisphaera lichenicola TaxID=2029860 RepID=UPI003EB8E2A5
MKDEPVHEHEHLTPTVIHHPEEDMTILARWLQRGMEQGAKFWLLVGGVMVAITALVVISSGLAAGTSANGQAWIELIPAKTAEDQLKVAEAFPKTPVAEWAKLRAAYEEYDNGLVDLTTPGKKETAGPRLKKALDLFGQVAAEAPKESSQAIGAALGVARTLEARNELPEAIKQYKFVASNWAGTPEAKQAEEFAKALEDPENVRFYQELYAYKPPTTPAVSPSLTLPPNGTGSFDFKSIIPDTPPPAGLDAPPPSTSPVPVTPTPESATPTPEPAKPEESKTEAAPKDSLPADPFAAPAPK